MVHGTRVSEYGTGASMNNFYLFSQNVFFIIFIYFCAFKEFITGVMAGYFSSTPTHMEGNFHVDDDDYVYDDDDSSTVYTNLHGYNSRG